MAREEAIVAVSSKVLKAGVGTTGVSAAAKYTGLAQKLVENSELITVTGVVVGTALTILSFLISTYFKWREDKRKQQAHNNEHS